MISMIIFSCIISYALRMLLTNTKITILALFYSSSLYVRTTDRRRINKFFSKHLHPITDRRANRLLRLVSLVLLENR